MCYSNKFKLGLILMILLLTNLACGSNDESSAAAGSAQTPEAEAAATATPVPPTPSPKQESTWQEFAPEDGSFSVMLPDTPDKEVQMATTEDGQEIPTNIYSLQTTSSEGELRLYMVFQSASPLLAGASMEQREASLFQGRDKALANKPDAVVLREETFSFDGHPALEFEFETGENKFLFRSIATSQYIYQLMIAGKNDTHFDNTEDEQFVNSFELAKETATVKATPLPGPNPEPVAGLVSFQDELGISTLLHPAGYLLSQNDTTGNWDYSYSLSNPEGSGAILVTFSIYEEPISNADWEQIVQSPDLVQMIGSEVGMSDFVELDRQVSVTGEYKFTVEAKSPDGKQHGLLHFEASEGVILYLVWKVPQTEWADQETAIRQALTRFTWSPQMAHVVLGGEVSTALFRDPAGIFSLVHPAEFDNIATMGESYGYLFSSSTGGIGALGVLFLQSDPVSDEAWPVWVDNFVAAQLPIFGGGATVINKQLPDEAKHIALLEIDYSQVGEHGLMHLEEIDGTLAYVNLIISNEVWASDQQALTQMVSGFIWSPESLDTYLTTKETLVPVEDSNGLFRLNYLPSVLSSPEIDFSQTLSTFLYSYTMPDNESQSYIKLAVMFSPFSKEEGLAANEVSDEAWQTFIEKTLVMPPPFREEVRYESTGETRRVYVLWHDPEGNRYAINQIEETDGILVRLNWGVSADRWEAQQAAIVAAANSFTWSPDDFRAAIATQTE